MGNEKRMGANHPQQSDSASKSDQRKCSELLAKLQGIRTLPVVAMKVNDLINDPNSSSQQIADLLKKDPALTAKLLKLVNSSYYSIPGGVADVQKALAFLGFNTVAQLVLSVSVFSLFSSVECEDFSMTEFWRHSLATAVCSEAIARIQKAGRPPCKPEEAFTCGLLHDIGKLALNEIDSAVFLSVVREAKRRGCAFTEVEREMGLPEHSFIGESVATRWGLPQNIRLCIRHHHDAEDFSSTSPLVAIVRLANAICIKTGVGSSGDYSQGEVSAEMLSAVGISFSDVPKIEEQLRLGMEKAGAFLNV